MYIISAGIKPCRKLCFRSDVSHPASALATRHRQFVLTRPARGQNKIRTIAPNFDRAHPFEFLCQFSPRSRREGSTQCSRVSKCRLLVTVPIMNDCFVGAALRYQPSRLTATTGRMQTSIARRNGVADRTRACYHVIANDVLYQLSYSGVQTLLWPY